MHIILGSVANWVATYLHCYIKIKNNKKSSHDVFNVAFICCVESVNSDKCEYKFKCELSFFTAVVNDRCKFLKHAW